MADVKELWVGWTRDAMRNYVLPDDVKDADDLVDDMSEVACKYADEMVEQFESRFAAGSRRRGRRQEPADREAAADHGRED